MSVNNQSNSTEDETQDELWEIIAINIDDNMRDKAIKFLKERFTITRKLEGSTEQGGEKQK